MPATPLRLYHLEQLEPDLQGTASRRALGETDKEPKSAILVAVE
jgi:hypothetical protein